MGTGPVITRYFQGPDGKYYKIEMTQEQKKTFVNIRSNEALSIFLQDANNKVEVQKEDIPTDAEEVPINGEPTTTTKLVTKDWRRSEKAINKAKERVDNSVYFTPDQKDEYEAEKAKPENNGNRFVLLTEKDMKAIEKYGLGEAVKTDGDKRTIDSDKLKELSLAKVGDDYIYDVSEREGSFGEKRLFRHLGYDVQAKYAAPLAAAAVPVIVAGLALTCPDTEKTLDFLDKKDWPASIKNLIARKHEVWSGSAEGNAGKVSEWKKTLLGPILLGVGGAMLGAAALGTAMKKENQTVTETKEGFTYFEKEDCNCDSIDGGERNPVYPKATVEHIDEEAVDAKPPKHYKMQKGDRLIEVVKAKYGVTDMKILRQLCREVRKASGIPETGYDENKNPVFPILTIDGKQVKDAYFLPETIQIGGTTYTLDMDKEPFRPGNTPGAKGRQGASASVTRNGNGKWIVKDNKGRQIGDENGYDNKQAADDYKAAWEKEQRENIDAAYRTGE